MSGKCATLGEPSLLLRFLGDGPALTRKATYWESLVETATAPLQAWIVADCVDLYPTDRPLPHFYQEGGSATT